MQDFYKPYGIIREEQTFQLIGTTKDIVDIPDHAKIMRDVSQGAKDLEMHLHKAMKRGPTTGWSSRTRSTKTSARISHHNIRGNTWASPN